MFTYKALSDYFCMENKNIIKIQKKLISIINSIRQIPKEEEKLENFNFVQNSHLDSMEFLKFSLMIEKKFKIKLKNFNISQKNFQTAKGLSKIISKLLKK